MLKSHISYGKFLNYFTIFVLLGKIYGGQTQCPGQNQNCIIIEKCPDLLSILEKSMNNPDAMELVIPSRCDHSSKQYKVCCTAGNIGKIYGGHAQCPNRNQNCIVIRECPELLSILEKSVINADEIELLQASQCGYSRNQPKVCCTAATVNKSSRYNPPSDLLPAPGQCGKSQGQSIFGGNVARLDEFQWMALIEFANPSGRRFLCGGALISNRYVLTAAHCVKNRQGLRIISVRLGENNLETEPDCEDYCVYPSQDVPVEESIPHEDFDANSIHGYHDIAVLRLQRPVEFTDYISPICLPSSLDTSYQGLKMTVAGWGRKENRFEISGKKMKLDVLVKPQEECKRTYQKRKILLKESQLCAGGIEGKDSCKGDSGWPLMFLNETMSEPVYYVTGIVSFGPRDCGSKDVPAVYTKVVDYIPWIISNLRP